MLRYTGGKSAWGLYHAESVSATFDKDLLTQVHLGFSLHKRNEEIEAEKEELPTVA